MKTCDKCVYAEWEKTKTGRLHPLRQGQCRYSYPLPPPLPNALSWWWGMARMPDGGRIQRGHEYATDCPYWSAAK